MASINIMFTDNKYGVQNASYVLNDIDIHRLYKANLLNRGVSEDYLLEREIDPSEIRQIVNDYASEFVGKIVQSIYDLEMQIAIEKAKSNINVVKCDLQV